VRVCACMCGHVKMLVRCNVLKWLSKCKKGRRNAIARHSNLIHVVLTLNMIQKARPNNESKRTKRKLLPCFHLQASLLFNMLQIPEAAVCVTSPYPAFYKELKLHPHHIEHNTKVTQSALVVPLLIASPGLTHASSHPIHEFADQQTLAKCRISKLQECPPTSNLAMDPFTLQTHLAVQHVTSTPTDSSPTPTLFLQTNTHTHTHTHQTPSPRDSPSTTYNEDSLSH